MWEIADSLLHKPEFAESVARQCEVELANQFALACAVFGATGGKICFLSWASFAP